MEKSNKKKIGIAVVILLILFLLSFFVAKTITDNSKDKKEDTINNVSDKDNSTSSDNNSTKSQEKDEKEDEQEETFLIKFAYDNGTILQSTFVKKGELPVYSGPTPYIKGYKFIGWNRKIREASEDTTYFAVFRKIETEEEEEEHPYIPPVKYTITVEIEEGQEGNCTVYGGSGTYARGANVDIYANPAGTYATEWDDLNTSNPRKITVTGNKTYIAHFVEGKKLTYLDSSDGTNKTVSIKKDETIKVIFEHGTTCNEDLTMNEDKNANAIYSSKEYDPDWTFKGYVYNNQVSPKTLTAAFVKKVEITTGVNNESWGEAFSSKTDPEQPSNGLAASNVTLKYDKGDEVYIYAKPKDSAHDFVEWNDHNTENPRKITANSNTTYTATFVGDYNYMYLDNIGDNSGSVTMSADDGDEIVYKKTGEQYDLYVTDGHPDGKYYCPVPEFYLDYRIDTYNEGDWNFGFWKSFNSLDNFKTFETVNVDKNQRICFRAAKNKNGKNINTRFCYMFDLPSDGETDTFFRHDSNGYHAVNQLVSAGVFGLTGDTTFGLDGSIMSLLDGKGKADSKTVFINSDKKQDNYFTFGCMFYNEKRLKSISESFVTPETISIACYYSTFRGTGIEKIPENLLPATQLENSCYAYMFDDCDSLTDIPENLLPATYDNNSNQLGLTGRCYWYMFSECDALETVPLGLLPATQLLLYDEKPGDWSDAKWEDYLLRNSNCYRAMFSKCTKLTQAPNLPATVLQPSCYEDMFSRCYSLVTAPYLPATSFQNLCYSKMFCGCTKLVNVSVAFGSFDEAAPKNATTMWLGTANIGTNEEPVNVGPSLNTGTFTWSGESGIASGDGNNIPSGWTKVHADPAPALFMVNPVLPVVDEIDSVVINDEKEVCNYILKVDIIDDNVWYSVYEYNEDTKLYDLVSSDMKTDLVEDHDYGLNYFFSDNEILDINDIVCEDGLSLISIQEA